MFKKKGRVPESAKDERHLCHSGHIWIETRRASVPPGRYNMPFKSTEGEAITMRVLSMMEEAREGWTVIELKCSRCGDVTSRKMPYTGKS